LRPFLAALSFLTIFPVSGRFSSQNLARSLIFYPVVGCILGGLCWGIYALIAEHLPVPILSFAVILLYTGVTGALHLDGVGDVCDAFGTPGRNRTRLLSIMRDSRIGAFGAVGIFMVLLGKLIFIDELLVEGQTIVVFLMPLVGRGLIVPCIVFFPYARSKGLGSPLQKAGGAILILSLLCMSVPFILYWDPRPVVALIPALTGLIFMALYFRRRLGGLTGDIYGFLIEISELVFLFGVILIPQANNIFQYN